MNSVLQTRVDGNNPPDIVTSAQVGQLTELVKNGDVLPLTDLVSAEALTHYPDSVLDIVKKDSTPYALMHASALKGLVYYNPSHYDGPTDPKTWAELTAWTTATAKEGHTPWCIALESGSASGWPATGWIEELFLTSAGADAYDKWTRGEISWTSQEMKTAWETFGAVAANEDMVNGGPVAAISTNFIKGLLPMWSDPPRCSLAMQADWLPATVSTRVEGIEVGKTIDFFIAPPVKPENEGLIEISGNILAAFKDSPEVRAFMEYMASPEAQNLVAQTGLWLPTNSAVADDAFPSPDRLAQAQIIKESTGVFFDASDTMPSAENEAFWAATLEYVDDPTQLDTILADLEKIRLTNR